MCTEGLKNSPFPPFLFFLAFWFLCSINISRYYNNKELLFSKQRRFCLFTSVFGSNLFLYRNVPASDKVVKIHVNNFPVFKTDKERN